jgi:hypothetical protein
MARYSGISWVEGPQDWGPIATYAIDFSADPSLVFSGLEGFYQQKSVRPSHVTADNLNSGQMLSLKFGAVEFKVSGYTRMTFAVPQGASSLSIASIVGTAAAAQFIFAATDLIARADQVNFGQISSPGGRKYIAPSGSFTAGPTDNGAFLDFTITAPASLALPDVTLAQIGAGYWLEVRNSSSSTQLLTIGSVPGQAIEFDATSYGLAPGQSITLLATATGWAVPHPALLGLVGPAETPVTGDFVVAATAGDSGPGTMLTGTLRSDVTVAQVPAGCTVNFLGPTNISGPAGTQRQLNFQTSGVNRWLVIGGHSGAETGGNAGSDFYIQAESDSGAFLSNPLSIKRSTGAVTLFNDLTVAGTITTNGNQLNVTGASPGLFLTGSVRNWRLISWTDGAFYLTDMTGGVNAFSVSNGGGYATFYQLATFNGSLQFNGAAGSNRYINALTSGSVRWGWLFADGGAETGANAGSNVNIIAYSDAGASLGSVMSMIRATQVVSFSKTIVNGPSDRSLKENIAPLEDALAKVHALQGVRFNFIADEDKRPQIGLIAQDVEAVVPEVVQEFRLPDADGGRGEPKLALDYPKLVALLIEAVKELTGRVAALEAKPAPA